ncbi:MAG: SpoIID/LytB domain-containing protein [Candidatus Marinimicrobia bacterium]|nr:SpoIID/LytB domain-containing protein [Candidatus Neomarinimicrobiota bacterium]MDD5582050.1 SpoIID/LytB domain-containing protein [Candidatus Neomarinimicrobiota bacterium]
MLEPNVIPRFEPRLRVGIVLPQDDQQEIQIEFPNDSSYIMKVDDAMVNTQPGAQIVIRIAEKGISIDNSPFTNAEKIVFKHIRGDHGIAIHPVISGRNFHWKKYIMVHLPAKVEVTRYQDTLLVVNELDLETYLACVATSEMGSACPLALIEAQTIVARSWMLANVEQKHLSLDIDVCNDDCCQRYQGLNNITDYSLEGAKKTRGKVLLYNGKIADARYSKACGGITERYENIWFGDPLPYMQNLKDMPNPENPPDLTIEENARKWILDNPKAFCSEAYVPAKDLKNYLGSVDEEGKYFRWTIMMTNKELTENINEKLGLQLKAVKDIYPIKRGGSGRMILMGINVIDEHGNEKIFKIKSDYEARRILHKKFLYSSAIIIDKKNTLNDIPQEFIFHGAGWGHGAGMCQIGALGMALAGYSTEEILTHYYPGTELVSIYK